MSRLVSAGRTRSGRRESMSRDAAEEEQARGLGEAALRRPARRPRRAARAPRRPPGASSASAASPSVLGPAPPRPFRAGEPLRDQIEEEQDDGRDDDPEQGLEQRHRAREIRRRLRRPRLEPRQIELDRGVAEQLRDAPRRRRRRRSAPARRAASHTSRHSPCGAHRPALSLGRAGRRAQAASA